MAWENIIKFTERNTPYRFKVSSLRSENSNECRISVQELDERDNKVDEFEFVYDVALNMPEADYKLHEKPINTIVVQMLAVNDNPKSW